MFFWSDCHVSMPRTPVFTHVDCGIGQDTLGSSLVKQKRNLCMPVALFDIEILTLPNICASCHSKSFQNEALSTLLLFKVMNTAYKPLRF